MMARVLVAHTVVLITIASTELSVVFDMVSYSMVSASTVFWNN
jgi:hypothetical protein